jgi:hypothetical protein
MFKLSNDNEKKNSFLWSVIICIASVFISKKALKAINELLLKITISLLNIIQLS